MQPDNLKVIEGLHEFLHEIWMIFVPIIILMFGREIIIQWISGLLWRWRSPYENREIVQIDGRLARINHIGLLKTELNLYSIEKDKDNKPKVTGGWTWIISNDKLADKNILKRLENIPEDILNEFDAKQ